MIRIAAVLAVLLTALSGSALASPPQHPGQKHYAVIQTVLDSKPQTLHTKQVVPNVASAKVDVFVNGKVLLFGGADSNRQVEIAGKGVLAVVSVTRKAGPGIVRLASARHDAVRVRIVFNWR